MRCAELSPLSTATSSNPQSAFYEPIGDGVFSILYRHMILILFNVHRLYAIFTTHSGTVTLV